MKQLNKITKEQAKANRKAVREYWDAYLHCGWIMGWLLASECGNVWMAEEPQGQTWIVPRDGVRVVHEFGDFYRAHGQLPKHVTLRDFTAELGIDEYLAA